MPLLSRVWAPEEPNCRLDLSSQVLWPHVLPKPGASGLDSSRMFQNLLPIQAIARKLHLPEAYIEPIGAYGAKLKLDILSDPAFPRRGNLILVTATTPTASGEAKTATSLALTPALECSVPIA